MTKYTPEQRIAKFWARVDKSGGDDACWLWTAGLDNKGYGTITWMQKSDRAHRVSYRLTFGELPSRILILHSCDNPACVNPAHLSLGTHQNNSDDKISKGRGAWVQGETHPNSKLTRSQVDEIRRLFAEGELSQQQIAYLFNISRANIGYIVRGMAWKSQSK